jgi:hypothetical protein
MYNIQPLLDFIYKLVTIDIVPAQPEKSPTLMKKVKKIFKKKSQKGRITDEDAIKEYDEVVKKL